MVCVGIQNKKLGGVLSLEMNYFNTPSAKQPVEPLMNSIGANIGVLKRL